VSRALRTSGRSAKLSGETLVRLSDNATLKDALDANFFLSEICPQKGRK
jgi:hypothetical protein